MWTPENRSRYNWDKLCYPSDLTDEKWTLIEPLIPPAERGGRAGTRARLKVPLNRVRQEGPIPWLGSMPMTAVSEGWILSSTVLYTPYLDVHLQVGHPTHFGSKWAVW